MLSKKILALTLSLALLFTSAFAIGEGAGIGGGTSTDADVVITAKDRTVTLDMSSVPTQEVTSSVYDLCAQGMEYVTTLRVQSVPDPAYAQFTCNGNVLRAGDEIGAAPLLIRFTPVDMQTRTTASLTFTLAYGTVASNPATLTVNLTGNTSAAPTIYPVNKDVASGSSLYLSFNDFLSSYTKSRADKSLAKVRITSLPQHGALTINGQALSPDRVLSKDEVATLVYQPTAAFSGADSFGWMASEMNGYWGDDDLWSNESYVSVSITGQPIYISSLTINGGSAATTNRDVTLAIEAVDDSNRTSAPDQMSFSSDGSNWSSWVPFAVSYTYRLPNTAVGTCYVYARVRDSQSGAVSATAYDAIRLDAPQENDDPFTALSSLNHSGSGQTLTITGKLHSTSHKDGVVSYSLGGDDSSAIRTMVKNQDNNQSGHAALIFQAPTEKNATGWHLTMPAVLMHDDLLAGVSSITFQADDFSLALPLSYLEHTLNARGNKVELIVSESAVRPLTVSGASFQPTRAFTITMLVDGSPVGEVGPTSQYELTFPLHQYVTYADQLQVVSSDGAAAIIPASRYNAATQSLSVKLTHGGTYEAGSVNGQSFYDLGTSNWAQAYIYDLANKQVVNGVGNGAYAPSDTITRASYVKMLCGALNLMPNNSFTVNYPDVPYGQWYYPWVATAQHYGILSGTFGNFRPNEPITREDMALYAYNAVAATGSALPVHYNLSAFTDFNSISPDAQQAVYAMVRSGIISGYTDGSFKPQGSAARSEAAKIISMVLSCYLEY